MSEDKLNQKEVRRRIALPSLSILLHTHYAIRPWEGGAKRRRHPVTVNPARASSACLRSLPGPVWQPGMRSVIIPGADMLLVRLEEALSQASEQIRQQVAGLEAVLNNIPRQIS